MSGEFYAGLWIAILLLLGLICLAALVSVARHEVRMLGVNLMDHVVAYKKHVELFTRVCRPAEVDRACDDIMGELKETEKDEEPMDSITEIKQRCHEDELEESRKGKPIVSVFGVPLPEDVVGRYVMIVHKDPAAIPPRRLLDKEEWLIVTAKDILERHCS